MIRIEKMVLMLILLLFLPMVAFSDTPPDIPDQLEEHFETSTYKMVNEDGLNPNLESNIYASDSGHSAFIQGQANRSGTLKTVSKVKLSGAYLSFWHILKTSNPDYSKAVIEYSIDEYVYPDGVKTLQPAGTIWHRFSYVSEYYGDGDYHFGTTNDLWYFTSESYPEWARANTLNNGLWKREIFKLPFSPTTNINGYIRFVFNDNNAGDRWYIDDIKISHNIETPANVPFPYAPTSISFPDTPLLATNQKTFLFQELTDPQILVTGTQILNSQGIPIDDPIDQPYTATVSYLPINHDGDEPVSKIGQSSSTNYQNRITVNFSPKDQTSYNNYQLRINYYEYPSQSKKHSYIITLNARGITPPRSLLYNCDGNDHTWLLKVQPDNKYSRSGLWSFKFDRTSDYLQSPFVYLPTEGKRISFWAMNDFKGTSKVKIKAEDFGGNSIINDQIVSITGQNFTKHSILVPGKATYKNLKFSIKFYGGGTSYIDDIAWEDIPDTDLTVNSLKLAYVNNMEYIVGNPVHFSANIANIGKTDVTRCILSVKNKATGEELIHREIKDTLASNQVKTEDFALETSSLSPGTYTFKVNVTPADSNITDGDAENNAQEFTIELLDSDVPLNAETFENTPYDDNSGSYGLPADWSSEAYNPDGSIPDEWATKWQVNSYAGYRSDKALVLESYDSVYGENDPPLHVNSRVILPVTRIMSGTKLSFMLKGVGVSDGGVSTALNILYSEDGSNWTDLRSENITDTNGKFIRKTFDLTPLHGKDYYIAIAGEITKKYDPDGHSYGETSMVIDNVVINVSTPYIDSISILKALAGIHVKDLSQQVDVNKDGKIGLAEAIYAIQKGTVNQ